MPTVKAYGQQKAQSQMTGANMLSLPGVPVNPTSNPGVAAPGSGANAPMTQARRTNVPMASAARAIGGAGPMKRPNPTDSFGVAPMNPGAIGQGIANLGQGVSNFAKNLEVFQHRVATTEAEEALVDFERQRNDMFFRPGTSGSAGQDPDPGGYFNTRGHTAYQNAKPTVERLKEMQREYADTLESPIAREIFMKSSEAQLTRAQTEVMRHASREFDSWETKVLEGQLENTLETSALYWDDADRRALALEIGRDLIIDLGFKEGLTGADIAERMQTYNSKFAMASIEAATANSAEAGQAALAEMAVMLEAPDLLSVQKNLDEQMRIERERTNAATAVTTATTLVQQYGDQDNARELIMAEVNAVPDADLRAGLMREANYQLGIKQQADSEARAEAFSAGESVLMGGGSIDDFIVNNADQWHRLDEKQKRTLLNGLPVQTDIRQFNDVMMQPVESLRNVNPNDYVGVFAPAELEKLRNAVETARTDAGQSRTGQTRFSQTNMVIEGIIGDSSNDWNNEQSQNALWLHSMIDDEVAVQQEKLNRPLTSSEYRGVLNGVAREAVVGRNMFGSEKTMSILEIEDVYDSASDMLLNTESLATILRSEGVPVTTDNLVKLRTQIEQRSNGAR